MKRQINSLAGIIVATLLSMPVHADGIGFQVPRFHDAGEISRPRSNDQSLVPWYLISSQERRRAMIEQEKLIQVDRHADYTPWYMQQFLTRG